MAFSSKKMYFAAISVGSSFHVHKSFAYEEQICKSGSISGRVK